MCAPPPPCFAVPVLLVLDVSQVVILITENTRLLRYIVIKLDILETTAVEPRFVQMCPCKGYNLLEYHSSS